MLVLIFMVCSRNDKTHQAAAAIIRGAKIIDRIKKVLRLPSGVSGIPKIVLTAAGDAAGASVPAIKAPSGC